MPAGEVPARYRIILAKRAADDLERIFDDIAKDSPQNAPRMVDRILKTIRSLDTFPHRGNMLEEPRLEHPVRCTSVQSYLVFFRVIDEQKVVRILRVRHGARRPPDQLE